MAGTLFTNTTLATNDPSQAKQVADSSCSTNKCSRGNSCYGATFGDGDDEKY